MNPFVLSSPGLLVSVRSPGEAAAALAGGADVIDVKEPTAGSLGGASPSVCRQIADVVRGQLPWTMACGELVDGPDLLMRHLTATWRELESHGSPQRCFPSAIKVGLAGCGCSLRWRRQLAAIKEQLPEGVGQVLVIYADNGACDAPPAAAVLEAAEDLRPVSVLVDTFDKRSPGLLGHCSVSHLEAYRQATTAVGCGFALAGKLRIEQFSFLAAVGADIIAVRSAVCSGGRTGRVEVSLVRQARHSLGRSPLGKLPLKTGIMEKHS